MIRITRYVFIFLLFSNIIFLNNTNLYSKNYEFKSYKEAIKYVKNAKFKYIDSFKTSRSSWITGANYSSNDKRKGYLIIYTYKKNYIFDNFPINKWTNF